MPVTYRNSYIHYNHLNLPDSIVVTNKGNIRYVYDAAGIKQKKITTEDARVTTTLHLGGAVFKNDTLEFIAQEEGRVRMKDSTELVYDYFIKDHLGNVRTILTTERDTSFYPPVSHEYPAAVIENQLYENVYTALTTRPGSFYSNGTNGDTVQLLRKTTQSIGAGKLLKVMAKDRIHVKVDYYTPDEATDNSNANGLNSILSVLTNLLNNNSITTALHGAGSQISTDLNNSTPFTDFLTPQNGSGGSSMPKAYLNILFFDEQFKFVEQSSEIVQIETKGSGQTIYRVDDDAKEAIRNGYVYIYVSNESNNLVYFDNLQVTHERGPIIEETHYYLFGLAMAGISSKALEFGNPNNRIKFGGKEMQSQEFSDGSGLEQYDFGARIYDPQIGRMWQVDPYVEKYERQGPYVAFNDNPAVFADPTGKGGELTIEQREDGTFYLKVSAKIYVYSNQMNQDDVKCYASKIQNDIMSQWNNPSDGKGYGLIGKNAVDVVFDVSVEAVTTEQAESMAKDNKNTAINFMALVNDGTGSQALGNSGRYDVTQLDGYGTTDAAHDFGHLLGYYVPKGIPTMESPGAIEDDNNNHAWRSDPNEANYIMARVPGADQSQRSVHAGEYSRLGGGWQRRQTVSYSEGMRTGFGGLYAPTRVSNHIPIVNPDKPLTNTIYK